ncbi:MAG: fused MFS/spermidine synthase [Vicinamibacterales bacterium]
MHSRRLLPVLLLLFIGSGCAALIYEVVWFQLLQLVIGSSAISLAVLLGTFMGGLCLGSLGYSRVASARHHPLRMYALLEAAIGVIGLLVLVAMPVVGSAYSSWAGPGTLGVVLRALAAGVCLLPPTLLMGATLPALSRWIEMTPKGVAWLGFFYAGNTAGAVIGSVLAGFYLLRVYDLATATFVAVALNAAVAAAAFLVASISAYDPQRIQAASEQPGDSGARRAAEAAPASVQARRVEQRTIYLAIALSGFTALSAEVVWTRLLSLLFGGTTYTFSLILAGFLLGLGLGSSLASALARNLARPSAALGWCQAGVCAAVAWAGIMIGSSMPYWPIDPSISTSPWFNFQLDVARCLWTVLPGAVLWGASFPLALAASARFGGDQAQIVGRLFAANTLGAIVGALGAGALVAWVGSQHTQQFMIAVAATSALLMLLPGLGGTSATAPGSRFAAIGLVVCLGAGAVLLGRAIPPIPGLLVGYGRFSATWVNQAEFIYMGEGLNASVAVSRLAGGVLNYHNAGKVQASSEPQDMRLQRMLGHLTTLVPESPTSVFVIGFGAGVTAGAVSIDPRVERVTIAEIEPLVPTTVSRYFSAHNFDVASNPKVQIRIDDARHYLLTTKEKFDAITSDPLDPWVKGAAMLYSREFFDLVKRRLNPGGVVTLFVQLYSSNEEAVKSEIATFFETFPKGIVFGNTYNGAGYDLVLLGQADPAPLDIDALAARLDQPEYAPVAQSLYEVGYTSLIDLLSTYAGDAPNLRGWTSDAVINRDSSLRLQYLAGLGVNLRVGDLIYRNILAHRKVPSDVFTGSDAGKAALWEAIQNPPLR